MREKSKQLGRSIKTTKSEAVSKTTVFCDGSRERRRYLSGCLLSHRYTTVVGRGGVCLESCLFPNLHPLHLLTTFLQLCYLFLQKYTYEDQNLYEERNK